MKRSLAIFSLNTNGDGFFFFYRELILRLFISVLISFSLPVFIFAQINDCSLAQVVCNDEDIAFNPQGPGINDFADPDNDPGCLVALEQNSAWYYFEIDPAAPIGLELGFIINPNGGYGEDYDFAVYGPNVDCGNLGSPLRCSSASGACSLCPETGLGMGAMDVTEGPGTGDGFVMTITVKPGEGYYIVIDNWAGTSNGFELSWTGDAAAYLNCDATPPCALNANAGPNISACQGEEGIVLNGSSSGGTGNESYTWSGTNGGTDFLDDPNAEDPEVNLPDDFTGTIVYTLLVEEDECSHEDIMELVVNILPDVNISDLGILCQNDPPQTLVADPAGGDWGGAADGDSFDPIENGPGIHSVYYSYTDGNGCIGMDTLAIEVLESPEVTINPNPAGFCESETSLLLTATGSGGSGSNYTFSWDTPTGTATGTTYNATSAGQYTVIVTDANGCTGMEEILVEVYPTPAVIILDPGPICQNTDLVVIQAAPSGGTFSGSIITSAGEIYPGSVPAGTYTINYVYSDENNCLGASSMDITIIPAPEAIASNNGPLCANESILLFGDSNNGGSSVSYSWTGPNGYTSNVQNPTDATIGGAYILQVSENGCLSDPVSTIVEIGTTPDATASNAGPYCNGQTILLFGSTNANGNVITYNWSGPDGYTSSEQNPADASSDGVYSLIIIVDGCPSQIAMTEVVFSAPPEAFANNNGPFCEGDNIVLFGSTGSTGNVIEYNWTGPNGYTSNVQNPSDIVESGIYELMVSVDGCNSDPDLTEVFINSSPQPAITGQTTFCTGNSTTIDAGPGFNDYEWNIGSTNQTLEVSDSGTYSVTVTDNNGCTGENSIELTELASLTPEINGFLEFCEGSSTTLDVGPDFSSYEWTTGDTLPFIDIVNGGNYGVIVTDEEGCSGSTNVNVIAHSNPNIEIGGSTSFCIGGSTILDVGDGYTSYAWDNDSLTQSITVNVPGDYIVIVIDSFGCSGTDTVTIEESSSLSPVITGDDVFCENGSTVINAGSGFDMYLWSDGSTGQTLTIDVAGDYAVTVSDNQGCSGEATISVSEASPPFADVQTQAELCNTEAGGSHINLFDLILSGDMNGNWEDANNSGAIGFFTDLNFNNVDPGDYTFIYTTNSSAGPCPESSYQIIITVLDCSCPDVYFFNTDPLCNLDDILDLSTIENTSEPGNWTMIQTPPGSNPASLNGSVLNAVNADPGEYILEFTLQNQVPPGCTENFQVSIFIDQAPYAGNPSPPLELCMNDDELIDLFGLIEGEDIGGLWVETSETNSQGGAFDLFNGTFATANQMAGLYTFKYILYSPGICPFDTSVVSVMINPLPEIQIADANELDCNDPVQTLDAGGSSFGQEFEILWDGPGILVDGKESTLHPNVDKPGIYTLTITIISTGCSVESSVEVLENTNAPEGALITSEGPNCFGDENGFISIDAVTGGEEPYMFSFNNGVLGSDQLFANLTGGSYSIELVDANGCKWDTTIIISAPDEITLDLGPDIELGLGENGTVQAITNLTVSQIDSLIWNPDNIIDCTDDPCLEGVITPNSSGILSLTIIDQNGCAQTDFLNILIDKNRRVYIPNVFSPNGDNLNDIFYIFGDESQIVNIKRFLIFDRWGEVLFETKDAQVNDPEAGWNGLYQSKILNPGVYLYFAEIEFVDGKVEQYNGDVTLLK